MDRSSHPRSRRIAPVVATAAAAALLVAGCSSNSGGKKADESGAGISAGKASTPRMTIALITHAAPGDTFWDIVRKGAAAAAAKDNVKLVYSSDPNAGSQANLVQNAIDQKVDGIAVTLAKPDALKSVVAKAGQAGIPVVGFNSGVSDWKRLGLLEFFGQDESVAGEAFGNQLNKVGAKHTVCVIQEQGNIGLTQRCDGLKKTFKGKTDILYVNGTDAPSVKSTITAKLSQDSSIDFVATLAAPVALIATQSISDAGSKAKLATFDLNKDAVSAIQSGKLQWAIDQQPYLQGYLSVDSLWLYKNNGNYSGGGQQAVLTGPAIVDKTNIDKVAAFAAKGTR
ncbi:substrate-binding domain-containing protein [Streptomyces sp. NPDC002677]|uniref:substrate-binding domain-containing protein n=1 Tax=Streptomyces sp. NPDC002677 TaxID=3154774 RepID=UPI003332B4EF